MIRNRNFHPVIHKKKLLPIFVAIYFAKTFPSQFWRGIILQLFLTLKPLS